MGSLQLVPQTTTTRKAETYSNPSTTLHEQIPSSYRTTRFHRIGKGVRTLFHPLMLLFVLIEGKHSDSRDGINVN